VKKLLALSASLAIGLVVAKVQAAEAFCPLDTYDGCNYWELPGYQGPNVTGGSTAGAASSGGATMTEADYRALYDAAAQLPPDVQAEYAMAILASLYSGCTDVGYPTANCQCLVNDLRGDYSDFRLIYIAIYNDYYKGLGETAHPYLQAAGRACGVAI